MIILKCEYCNKEVEKLPNDVRRSKHHYCSISCSNRHKPKRKLKNKCKDCQTLIRSSSTYCRLCLDIIKSKCTDNSKLSNTFRPGSNKYGSVRSRAKALYSSLRQNGCQICGYSKHVEICHIKPISEFSEDTIVKDINHCSNITLLCRNCHWELDHGMIKKSTIKHI